MPQVVYSAMMQAVATEAESTFFSVSSSDLVGACVALPAVVPHLSARHAWVLV